MSEFAIADLTTGRLNALVKNIMDQMKIADPVEAVRRMNAGEWVVSDSGLRLQQPSILTIDRSKPFKPVEFIGSGWSIDEEDERSLALTEIDLSQVNLVTMLREQESFVRGEEKLRRLKEASHIRLDAKIFQTLWENQALIPEEWRGTLVFFDGTVLRSPYGSRNVLYLDWRGRRWYWHYYWLDHDFNAVLPSAVLASSA